MQDKPSWRKAELLFELTGLLFDYTSADVVSVSRSYMVDCFIRQPVCCPVQFPVVHIESGVKFLNNFGHQNRLFMFVFFPLLHIKTYAL